MTSEQSNYLSYGHWLLLAGRTKEAHEALTTAVHAATVTQILGQDKHASLHQAPLNLLGLGFGLLGEVDLQHALVIVSAHLPRTLGGIGQTGPPKWTSFSPPSTVKVGNANP
jgi:hypothetical protein